MINVENLPEKLGQRIKIERMKAKISQERLAELANIHIATLSKLERGENYATIDTIAKVANALNLDFNGIFNFNF